MSNPILVATLALGMAAGPPAEAPDPGMEMGPPPPGYIKITGEPVPNWTPASMLGPSPNVWTFLGSQPIEDEYWSGTDMASGRVVSLAPHPSDANTVYAASASGGLWKTTDGGVNWMPMTDELATLNHGCVALDPSNPNTVYLGTGEYTTRSTGDGLFKSTDGGVNWTKIATRAQVGTTCSKIIVDPSDSKTIHIAGNTGYHRTANGGASWSTLLAPSQSSPSVVYTAIIDGSNGLLGLYRSPDAGTTWVNKSATPNFPSPQGWYDAFIGVDPRNADVVYGGGVFPTYAVNGIIKSTDGGDSWTEIACSTPGNIGSCLSSPNVHPDMHTIAFATNFDVWVGSDGGVWKRPDGTTNWVNTNQTLAVTQNYEIAINPLDPIQVMGAPSTATVFAGTYGRGAWKASIEDLTGPSATFTDGFESGDTSQW